MGLPLSEWEAMTPRELDTLARGYGRRRRDEQELQQANNYALALLIRAAVWEKKMPEYRHFFPERGPKEEMSDEAMYAQIRALNALFGGTEE